MSSPHILHRHESKDRKNGGHTSEQWREFWQRQFADLEAPVFPAEPPTSKPGTRNSLRQTLKDMPDSSVGQSLTCVVRAAWAIVQARHTGSTDVIFGANLSTLASSEEDTTIKSPSDAKIVPIRVRLSWESTVVELLERLEQQAMEMESFTMDTRVSIAQVSEEAREACRFRTTLNVHGKDRKVASSTHCSDNLCDVDVLGDCESVSRCPSPMGALVVDVEAVEEGLDVTFDYESNALEKIQTRRLLHQFETVLRQIFGPRSGATKLESLQTASHRDIQDLWAWNPAIADPPALCVHDLLHCNVPPSRTLLAVDAWDGMLTYGELDDFSTALARTITMTVLPPNPIISLIFDKTVWSTVAMLAVMKAGAAATLLPASHPEARLRQMIEQVDSKLVLASSSAQALAERLTTLRVITVDSEGMQRLCKGQESEQVNLPKVIPSSPLCVLFTSGSTGTPKAAVLSHKNMVAALIYQKDAHRLDQSSRYLDLAPNTGDAIWMNTLLPLSHGACLCVPSDDTRLGTDMFSLRKFKATYALVAPTMADTLYDLNLPELKTLILAGEPLSPSHIAKWRERGTQVLNGYGPAECTPIVALHDVSGNAGETVSIGRLIGSSAWIVDEVSGNSLVGIGMIGELWLESPLVGQGYLNDEVRTKQAFVSNPPWLRYGTSGNNGRGGRLYKTGDLVKYQSDGTLVVIGRKGTMVTMRGQRLEPGDVEYHLMKELGASGALQVAVEIVVPPGRKNQRLVAFVSAQLLRDYPAVGSGANLEAKTKQLRETLSHALPYYMVPTDILPIDAIPTAATTKVDRRRLRELGKSRLASPLALRRRQPARTPRSH